MLSQYRRWPGLTVALLLVLWMLAAPLGAGPAPVLRVGFGSQPDFTDFWAKWTLDQVARQTGVQVKVTHFENGPIAYRSLVAGAVDVVFSGGIGAVLNLARQARADRLMVVMADLVAPDYILLGREGVNSLADLEGKRVGISSPGDISDVLSRAMLRNAGVDVNKVQIVRVGGTSARIAALGSGAIEAGVAHAFDAILAMQRVRGLKVLAVSGEIVPDYLQHIVATRESFLTANESLMRALVFAHMDAARRAASDRAGYITLAKAELGVSVPDAVWNQAYDLMYAGRIWGVDGGLDPARVRVTQELELEAKNITAAVPLRDWGTTKFIAEYLRQKGSFKWR